MEPKHYVEITMAITMPLVILLIMLRTIRNKTTIGARTVQFICVGLLIPTIIILAIEKVLTGETVGTIIGALSGYVLSGVGAYDSKKPKKNSGDTVTTD